MPIIFQKVVAKNTTLAVWEVTETVDFFLNELFLNENEKEKTNKMVAKRRLEWLASRFLIQTILGKPVRCESDEFGKPFLANSNDFVSISHSHNCVAVMISPLDIGLDIQYFTPKMAKIAHKFLHETDLQALSETHFLEHLHFYWCAKEALYKAYGKKNLDFKANLFVEPFIYSLEIKTKGCVKKDTFQATFDIFFQKINTYFLAYVLPTYS